MPIEIERKFLVASDAWKAASVAQVEIKQGYLSRGPPATVRVRQANARAFITIKSTTPGIVRSEFEYEIPFDHAEDLLRAYCVPPLIRKTRFSVDWQGLIWSVDVFRGEFEGLVIAEIELSSADQRIEPPPWIDREVTHDPAYRNEALSPP